MIKGIRSVLICLFSMIFINPIISIKVQMDIKPKQTKCLGEYLLHNSIALFEVTSEGSKCSVKLSDANGNVEYQKDNESFVKIAYTAKDSNTYHLCITNSGDAETRYEFRFKTGVSANDFSSVAKQSNIKPVESNVRINIYVNLKCLP